MSGADHCREQKRRALTRFAEVCALDPPEREARLQALDAQDPEVAKLVRRMFAAERDSPPASFSALAEAMADAEATSEGPLPCLPGGYRVDGFRILHEIGRGGMGTVYAAEHEQLGRRVALKVLSDGSEATSAQRRFRREIRALSTIDDPGIVRALDAGSCVEAGRTLHWFAMDLVEGVPIDQWARESGARRDEILRTVAAAARSVHRAHLHGVIHRDLKPSNVLVSRDGKPKIIDFGVAVAIDHRIMGTLGVTLARSFVGTLAYTSPEQFDGSDRPPDVRSDVYALGIVLYEMLAGAPAVDLEGANFVVALDRVRARGRLLLGRVDRSFRGDLEAVVAKATAVAAKSLRSALLLLPDRPSPFREEIVRQIGRFEGH